MCRIIKAAETDRSWGLNSVTQLGRDRLKYEKEMQKAPDGSGYQDLFKRSLFHFS